MWIAGNKWQDEFPFQSNHLSHFSPPSITYAIFSVQDTFLFIYQVMGNYLRARKNFLFQILFVSPQFQSYTIGGLFWFKLTPQLSKHLLNAFSVQTKITYTKITFEMLLTYPMCTILHVQFCVYSPVSMSIFFLFNVTLILTINIWTSSLEDIDRASPPICLPLNQCISLLVTA